MLCMLALSQDSLLCNASAGPDSLATVLSGADFCTHAPICQAMAVLCAESSVLAFKDFLLRNASAGPNSLAMLHSGLTLSQLGRTCT